MKTVKEISKISGVSVRTLHYYDEIGLLCPTKKTAVGYRLYDEKALEKLQQILFFREFDIPLKEIKAILENPDLDPKAILIMQRKMLVAQQERLTCLISGIDDILKGENKMDFAIFSKVEIEAMFEQLYERMPEKLRRLAVEEFGSVEQWKKQYLEKVSTEEVQKKFAKMVEWYGGKEAYLDAAAHPLAKDVAASYKKRIENIFAKLAKKRDLPPDSFAVKEIIGEYGFVMKQLTQIKDETALMKHLSWFQNSEPTKSKIDNQYGEGTAAFVAQAITAFYGEI